MASIKKGDIVQVIAGAKQDRGGDRGKQGEVLAVDRERNRVLVKGVKMVTKHKRVETTDGTTGKTTGGIEVAEAYIHISNVALIDPSTKKPTRLGSRVETVTRNGAKKTVRVRVAKSSGKDI
jgi:large subunit ribosomal protein L24